MTTTHIMSDETGQLILAQLQAISQALNDGALSNSQIDTVLADQSPTGAGFLDGGGLKRFFDGLQAQFADISHNHSGDALTPASVAATGAVSGSSISDGTGTLAQLRESVSQLLTVGTFAATSPAQEPNAAWYCDVPITVPQGYEVVGVVGFSTGATAKGVMEARWLGTAEGVVRVQGRTVYTDGGTETTVSVNVLFVRGI